MFGNKNNVGQLEAFKAAYAGKKNATAKTIIANSINELETKGDLAYTIGLIDMAYELEIISINERAAFSDKAHAKLK